MPHRNFHNANQRADVDILYYHEELGDVLTLLTVEADCQLNI